MQWWRQQPKCITEGCTALQAAHYRCRPHERLALTEGKSEHMQQKWLAKFRANIDPDVETGCWVWTGPTNEHGYGLHQAGGTWLAHRYGYVWFVGGHARGQVLDHLCNRPLCVRPDHMMPMSNTNNTSLRDERALAQGMEFFRHARATPLYLRMFTWALQHGLPCGKPSLP